MSADALLAARLVLKSGTPPTLLDTETIRAICEAYVRVIDAIQDPQAVRVNILRGVIAAPADLVWLHDSDGPVAKLVREEVLKERAKALVLIKAEIDHGEDMVAAERKAVLPVLEAAEEDRWGGGHYLRGQTEHVILAVRGRPMVQGENTASFFTAKRGAHSEKPDEAYAIFERVTPAPDGARLDLFACKTRKGWFASGAEVTPGAVNASKRGRRVG